MYYRIDDADLCKRFMFFSVLEKIPEKTLKEDRQRLKDFQTIALEKMTAPPCSKRESARPQSCGA